MGETDAVTFSSPTILDLLLDCLYFYYEVVDGRHGRLSMYLMSSHFVILARD